MPTPGEWRDLLEKRLDARWFQELGVYDAYFDGDHRLAFATSQFREAFGSLFAAIADNWMPLVVDASAERLKVQGFRLGDATESSDEAWAIWQANDLDSESDMAHTEAIKLTESYWLVAPPDTGDDAPVVTVEHPMQMIVACDPANRRKRLAAFKKFVDDEGYAHAIVYLPEQVVRWRSSDVLQKSGMSGTRINWVADEGASGSHELGEVPVIPLRNAPSMLAGGQSDLKVGIPIQDAVNKLLSDMLIGAEYQAYPQRVLMGVEVPRDENNQPQKAAVLQASKSRLWAFSSPDAKVAEFKAADLENYVKAREHLIQGLTAKTRTPPHYVMGQIVNASGDALEAAEVGLVAKVRKKMPALEAGHEDMMRLSFKAMGDSKRAGVKDSEVIWRDPETRSFGELVDGLVKLSTIGVPEEVLWEKAGFSPQEISRMKAMRMAQDLLPPTPAPGAVTERITVGSPAAPAGPSPTPPPAVAAPAVAKPAAPAKAA